MWCAGSRRRRGGASGGGARAGGPRPPRRDRLGLTSGPREPGRVLEEVEIDRHMALDLDDPRMLLVIVLGQLGKARGRARRVPDPARQRRQEAFVARDQIAALAAQRHVERRSGLLDGQQHLERMHLPSLRRAVATRVDRRADHDQHEQQQRDHERAEAP